MSADPAYQVWRGLKLLETIDQRQSLEAKHDAAYLARAVDLIVAKILNPARPVRQPDFAALGLGSADEAAERN